MTHSGRRPSQCTQAVGQVERAFHIASKAARPMQPLPKPPGRAPSRYGSARPATVKKSAPPDSCAVAARAASRRCEGRSPNGGRGRAPPTRASPSRSPPPPRSPAQSEGVAYRTASHRVTPFPASHTLVPPRLGALAMRRGRDCGGDAVAGAGARLLQISPLRIARPQHQVQPGLPRPRRRRAPAHQPASSARRATHIVRERVARGARSTGRRTGPPPPRPS